MMWWNGEHKYFLLDYPSQSCTIGNSHPVCVVYRTFMHVSALTRHHSCTYVRMTPRSKRSRTHKQKAIIFYDNLGHLAYLEDTSCTMKRVVNNSLKTKAISLTHFSTIAYHHCHLSTCCFRISLHSRKDALFSRRPHRAVVKSYLLW
jgi:hypothetical protein